MPEWAAARRLTVACWAAPAAAQLREPAETFVPLAVPAGMARGWAATESRYLSAKRPGWVPVLATAMWR